MKKYLFLPPLLLAILYFPSVSNAQTAEDYMNLAGSLYEAGHADSCVYYSLKAEPIIKKDSGEYSHAYARFADQYMGMGYEAAGQYLEAKNWYEKSIEIYRSLHHDGPDDFDFGEAAINTGNLYTTIGAYSEALPLLLKAREIFSNVPLQKSPAYAAAGNNLANIYVKLGDPTKAGFIYSDIYNRIFDLLKSDYNEPCATLLLNLGTTYQQQGLNEKALKTTYRALVVFDSLGANYKTQYLASLYNMGSIYSFLDKTDSATYYLNRGYKTAILSGDNYQAALFAQLMGKVDKKAGKYKNAEIQLKNAIGYSLKVDSLPTEIYYGAAASLAKLYYDTKRYNEADSIFTSILKKGYAQRLPAYKTLEDIYYWFCANAIALKKYDAATDSLGVLLKYTNNYIHKNFIGMSEAEKTNFINSLYKNFDLQCTLLSMQKKKPAQDIVDVYTNQLFLKGMVTYSHAAFLRKVQETNNKDVKEQFVKWRTVKVLLAKQYSFKDSAIHLNTDSLVAVSESLEKALNIALLGDDTGVRDFTGISTITEKIGVDDAAVEFIRFNYIVVGKAKDSAMYGAFIIKKGDTIPQFVLLCAESKLTALMQNKNGQPLSPNELVKYLYPAYDGAGKIIVSSSNRLLYNLIWRPLLPYLQNVNNVFYAQSGLLFNIAFNSMYNGGSGLLIDDYSLHSVFSTADINGQLAKTDWNVNPVSIWGNMDYNLNNIYDTANRLMNDTNNVQSSTDEISYYDVGKPGSNSAEKYSDDSFWPSLSPLEVNFLKKDFSGNNIPVYIYEKERATEDAFKVKMNGYKGTVHISTHGFYTPEKKVTTPIYADNIFNVSINPLLRCGLIFSGANYVWKDNKPLNGKEDGVLNAFELSQIDLSKVQLVTLSACETGLGDIKSYEGVFGLQRAFKIAGAQKMMVSLWKVPSEQTAELMIQFYQKWIKGASIYNALADTQKEMRKKYPPYYWAGFILIE